MLDLAPRERADQVTERFGQQMSSTDPRSPRPRARRSGSKTRPRSARSSTARGRSSSISASMGASMGDIARAAGVSKGTLYVYFENKAELFSALIADERKHGKRDFHLDPDSPDIADDLRALRPEPDRLHQPGAQHPVGPHRDGDRGEVSEGRAGLLSRRAAARHRLSRAATSRRRSRAGRLAVADCAMAARQLQLLFHAGIINELLYGIRGNAGRRRRSAGSPTRR